MIVSKTYAAESGHWYKMDGTPAYEQPCKSRPGEMRPTTIRDARVLALVPSVTTILKVAAQPGLERWKQQSLLHAALTLPRIENESEDAFAKRALEDAAAQSLAAREKGTAIHGAIEKWIGGASGLPDEMEPYCRSAERALHEAPVPFWDGATERSFANPEGYGGKIDLHGPDFVVDFKTKANWTDQDVKRGLAYDEHGMQLCAYARGLKIEKPRLFNIFIATDEPGKYHVHEWTRDEQPRLWTMFHHLLCFWKASNNIP